MSRVGDWALQLMELPAYSDGIAAFNAGRGRADNPFPAGDDHNAWLLGYQDAEIDAQPEPDFDVDPTADDIEVWHL